jgi:hypothetical protein
MRKSDGHLAMRGRGARDDEAYGRQLSRLLRARRERPRGSRAAEQRDESASSNVTCHAPLPRRHAQSNNITSLFNHSRQLRAGRNNLPTSGRSRASSLPSQS